MTPTTLLEPIDVARRLGVGPARVRGMARDGLLTPTAVTPRGVRLFAHRDVERLLERRRAVRRKRTNTAISRKWVGARGGQPDKAWDSR
jgi:DNA-binding transcriptional MerR regulator